MKCVCPSTNPGITIPPCASIRTVPEPTYLAISAESPTARILPSWMATAPGRAAPMESPVHTIPFVMTESAFGAQAVTTRAATATAAGEMKRAICSLFNEAS